jgi:SAM-dependent methyltransferase
MQQQSMIPFRQRIGKAASGRELDGIESGLNLPFYGKQTDRVVGIDPSLPNFAEERARKYRRLLRVSGEAFPIEDRSIDTVVVTFTLCTVDNPTTVLAEMLRVLRPGGRLLFAEHGRAPEVGVARGKAGSRPFGDDLRAVPSQSQGGRSDRIGGFRFEGLETAISRGRGRMGFVYAGSARAA